MNLCDLMLSNDQYLSQSRVLQKSNKQGILLCWSIKTGSTSDHLNSTGTSINLKSRHKLTKDAFCCYSFSLHTPQLKKHKTSHFIKLTVKQVPYWIFHNSDKSLKCLKNNLHDLIQKQIDGKALSVGFGPVLHISTVKELAFSKENCYQSGTNSLLV